MTSMASGLKPQDYFQYDVNVRMKYLHTQSKPNHDGTHSDQLPTHLQLTFQYLKYMMNLIMFQDIDFIRII